MKFSVTRRILFAAILIVLIACFAELVFWIGYPLLCDKTFPRREFRKQIAELITSSDDVSLPPGGQPIFDEREVLHPYLGYTVDVSHRQGQAPLLGYPLELMQSNEGVLSVALFGGSFAAELGFHAGPELTEGLRRITGRKVVLLNFGLGGYKQPQQFLNLAYLYALGARFDLVINVDGFNELTLAPAENIPQNVHPLYPRSWRFRVANRFTPDELSNMLGLERVDRQRGSWAGLFTHIPLSWSNTLLALWKVGDKWLERRAQLLRAELLAHRATAWEITGPSVTFSSDQELHRYLVRSWAECSIQMEKLTRANNADYEHFLQPNQYVRGAKPLSEEEQTRAVVADHPYGRTAAVAYSLLRQEGERLRRDGMNFHDLTLIFSRDNATRYNDNCCHLTPEGYRIVAIEIVKRIRRKEISNVDRGSEKSGPHDPRRGAKP